MTPTTLEALKKSIEHWRKNVADPEKASFSYLDCALCELFYKDDCKGCPVVAKTGFIRCRETPYYNAAALHDPDLPESFEEYRLAAEAELDFLISLLPEDEK